jgi:O-antigen/teichoic acid export membrane protein
MAGANTYRSGFTFGILSFLIVTAVSVLSALATARIYGVGVVGEFALAYAPVAALWVLSTAKEQAALVRELTALPPAHPRAAALFAAVFTFSAALTAVMALLAGLASWLIFTGPLHRPELLGPCLASLAGFALVTNTGWNIDTVLSSYLAGRELFWVRLHEAVSFLAIAVLLGICWHGVWGLVVATIAASLTALVHRTVVVRSFLHRRISRGAYLDGLRSLPGLLRFGLRVTPGNMAQGLSQQVGVWTIGALSATPLVGAYSRAQMVPERVQTVNMRIAEVLYPTLVSRWGRGDREGFERALVDSIRYGMSGMLLIAVALGAAAPAVLHLFGPGFSTATLPLTLLLLFPVLATVTFAQNQALLALDRPGVTSATQTVRLLITVGLTVALSDAAGLSAPAVALLTGLVAAILMNARVIAPNLTVPLRRMWPLRRQLGMWCSYGVALAGGRVLVDAVPSALVAVPAGTAFAGLLYVVCLLVLRVPERRDRARAAAALSVFSASPRVRGLRNRGSRGGRFQRAAAALARRAG